MSNWWSRCFWGGCCSDLISEFEGEYYTITVQTEAHTPSLTLLNDLVDTVKSSGETPDLAIGFPNQMWNVAHFDALRFLDDLAADASMGISLTDLYVPLVLKGFEP